MIINTGSRTDIPAYYSEWFYNRIREGYACVYCYANYDNETVKKNRKLHQVDSPFLIGGWLPEDEVRDAKQESNYVGQMSLF